ncbi:phage tail sheath protein [Streptobacillus moniliformis]|uniref:phage tail sheath protein n=1 Tax=Streptobacillus moniliformis TaxID=34105 RepID=UPI0007E2F186|nr:phage tail sheath protein [Streptobacillus moniliformis]
MSYKHGTYQSETKSDITLPVEMAYGYFIVGNAPMNKVKEKNRTVNKVLRIGSYKEAIEMFGDTNDLDFSISQAIKIFFELYLVSPLYVVNLVDVGKHKKTSTKITGLKVEEGKVLIKNHKIIPETVVVKNNTNSVEIVDKVLNWTELGLEIYVTPTNSTTVDVEFNEIDLSLITKKEAIGGYDTTTMQRTGLELLDEVFLNYSELPSFIDVPDFSHEGDVAAVMATKAKNMNGGMFETVALINAPLDKKYDELLKWKDDSNILDNDQIILYGKLTLAGNYYNHSTHYAALSLLVDKENDGVPCQTPSNYMYKCDGMVWKGENGYESLRLDKENQANFLNKNGIVTAINFKGWRCWGSETAKNPLATDPKDKFVYTRRMFKYIGNELVITYFDTVDKKFTRKLAETVTKSINIRLNSFVPNKLLEAKAEISKEDNGLINTINGDITWIIKLGIIPSLKSMTFKKKYDVDVLTNFAKGISK